MALKDLFLRSKNQAQATPDVATTSETVIAVNGIYNALHAQLHKMNNVGYGLQNFRSGLGGANDFSANNYRTNAPYLTYQLLDAYYRTSWVARRIIDLPASEMTRKWRQFTHADPEVVKKRQKFEHFYNIKGKVRSALKWADLYGGSAIVFKFTDEEDLSKPLKIRSIEKGSLEVMQVVIKDQANPTSFVEIDPLDKNYLEPQQYTIASSRQGVIHASRMIKFEGIELPIYSAMQQNEWGDSELTALLGLIDIVEGLWLNISQLVGKANVDVIQLESYMQTLAKTPDKIFQRLNLDKKMLSNFNTLLLDSKDTFARNELGSLAGLAEVMREFLKMIAGGRGIPLTKFLGEASGGFGTGDNELIDWYDKIATDQSDISPQMLRMDMILEMIIFGERKHVEFEWLPLFDMGDNQRSEVQARDATRDVTLVQAGIIPERVVGERLLAEGIYPSLTQEDIDLLSDIPGSDEPEDDFMGDESIPEAKEGMDKPSDKL